jgi:hypothetical protein
MQIGTVSFDFAQDEASFPSTSPLVLSEVEGQGRVLERNLIHYGH